MGLVEDAQASSGNYQRTHVANRLNADHHRASDRPFGLASFRLPHDWPPEEHLAKEAAHSDRSESIGIHVTF